MERWLGGLRKAGLPEYPQGRANFRFWLQVDIQRTGDGVRFLAPSGYAAGIAIWRRLGAAAANDECDALRADNFAVDAPCGHGELVA